LKTIRYSPSAVAALRVDMSVLSRKLIYDRLALPVTDRRSLVVTPILERQKVFDSDSLDLRLGSYFLLPRTPPQAYLHPGSDPSEHSNLRVHIPIGRYLVVPAHQTVLGATLEFIKLPYDVSGQILTKSSVARTFIVIETAPWIHPNYRGCLTLEIANVSNTPVLLYPGLPIAQLILLHVRGAKPASVLTGTYFGPIYPEPPPPKHLVQQFRNIGVDNPVVPGST
jgi:dCTP deaminase